MVVTVDNLNHMRPRGEDSSIHVSLELHGTVDDRVVSVVAKEAPDPAVEDVLRGAPVAAVKEGRRAT